MVEANEDAPFGYRKDGKPRKRPPSKKWNPTEFKTFFHCVSDKEYSQILEEVVGILFDFRRRQQELTRQK